MEASVQYNDYRGTAAADLSDFHQLSLQNYLIKTYSEYDGERYKCQGCSLFILGQEEKPSGHIYFVCLDSVENKYVKFSPGKSMSLDDIFHLFKRLEIVIGKDIDDIEVDNEYSFDLG